MQRCHLCKEAKATAAGAPLPRPHWLSPRREKGGRASASSSPDAAGRVFPNGWSHPQVGAWDSTDLTFPPLERVGALDNVVKSIRFHQYLMCFCVFMSNEPPRTGGHQGGSQGWLPLGDVRAGLDVDIPQPTVKMLGTWQCVTKSLV